MIMLELAVTPRVNLSGKVRVCRSLRHLWWRTWRVAWGPGWNRLGSLLPHST